MFNPQPLHKILDDPDASNKFSTKQFHEVVIL